MVPLRVTERDEVAKVGRILGLVALFGGLLDGHVVVLNLVNDGVLKVDAVVGVGLSDAADAVGFRHLLEDEFRVELPEFFGRVFAGLGEKNLFPPWVTSYTLLSMTSQTRLSGSVCCATWSRV